MARTRHKTPLYIQVYENLLEKIEEGIFKKGEFLPPEKELGTLFNVERQTVRRSLELLVNEGVLEKRPGVGSLVKDYGNLKGAGNTSGTLAFILPDKSSGLERITEPFNFKLFSSLEAICRQDSRTDFSLTYTTVKEGDDIEKFVQNYAGIFCVSRVNEAFLEKVSVASVPALVINNFSPHLVSVMEDSMAGAERGVGSLIASGHRIIAYINGIPGYRTTQERTTGYVKAMSDAGLNWQSCPREEGDWTFDGGFRAMQRILEQSSKPPTALFAANDMMAIGAIEALKTAQLKVPEDISVIGFDNIDQCIHMKPKLTTIGVNVEMMARVAFRNILNLMTNKDDGACKIVIPTDLIIRESTGPAKLE